jgi:DNA-binding response OmpR family regulator
MARRILVIDDEKVVLGAVRKALRGTDYEIDTVLTAEDGLTLMTGSPYDVVITDLIMPRIDGLELLRRMHDKGTTSPTILLTGFPTIQTALAAKKLGAFEYVTKPFTRQELLGVVTRALRSQALPDRATRPRLSQTGRPFYFVPGNSWVTLELEGTAQIGMAQMFARTLGTVASIEIPNAGTVLRQGKAFVVVETDDGLRHYLFSPLSGRVLEVNPKVAEDTFLALRNPEGTGWLLRLKPLNPEEELTNLVKAD